jgi:hypothetical protein
MDKTKDEKLDTQGNETVKEPTIWEEKESRGATL